MEQTIRLALDDLLGAIEDLHDMPIDEEDAEVVTQTLRQANRNLWGQINTVEAMIPINVNDVQAEVQTIGFIGLYEAGVLKVDRKAWWKWRNR